MRLLFLTFLLIYFAINSVVVIHMMQVLKPFKVKYVILAVYIFFILALMIGRFSFGRLDTLLPLDVSAWLTRLGYYWMGLLTFMFVWSCACMVLRCFNIGAVEPQHRIVFYLCEVVLCLMIFFIGFHIARNPVIVRHEINTNKGTELRIVQISDTHLGFMMSERNFTKIVNKIEEINPDILLITGDFLENERSYAEIKDIGRALRNLNPKYGIWAVTGNHEYIGGIENSLAYKETLGIKTLRDSTVFIDNKFLLIGQEDSAARRFGDFPLKTLDELFEQKIPVGDISACPASVPSMSSSTPTVSDLTPNHLTILITHQISNHTKYENRNIDLVLSGHTHNGQFFPWNLVIKRIFDIGYGLVKRGDSHFYVSSGTWHWGPPLRLGTKSEIVVFEIK